MPGRFDGKVVLVTGGASGIGEATVMAFAHEGADVVIADVNDAGGRDLVERLTATGHHATFVHTDVTDEGSVREMVNHAVSTFGGLHCAANVAGGMAGGDRAGLGVHETEAAQWMT